jgi:nucleotide-binding universal stress UspA family protein
MTPSPPRVLIAYDGSPSAASALRAAASLFREARVSVATVASEATLHAGSAAAMLPSETIAQLRDLARHEAEEMAEEAVGQARTLGLEAEPVVVGPAAPAWAALLEAARQLGADALVCGTRGRGAFARALLGSTSSSLLHRTDVPLLVVPDGGGALDGPVVAAYDGSDGATRAIETVGRLLPGHATVVVHAWESVYQSLETRALATAGPIADLPEIIAALQRAVVDRAAATTENGLAAARAAGLDAVGDTIEAHEGAWRAVAAAARAHGASVIAVGSRGLGGARSVLLGSVSSGLVQNAELPVLVVPGEPEDDG